MVCHDIFLGCLVPAHGSGRVKKILIYVKELDGCEVGSVLTNGRLVSYAPFVFICYQGFNELRYIIHLGG